MVSIEGHKVVNSFPKWVCLTRHFDGFSKQNHQLFTSGEYGHLSQRQNFNFFHQPIQLIGQWNNSDRIY